ncbi:MAG: hypothetical protein ISN26_02705 [Betaproteobacteria bacterium AqS2]|uniref:Uncharacterized protein n=1 Tax=Candidatus Amphirhobacter heronislandensis TaxID=1732024 RepID=A0A930UGT7_9GAMM|nr:hypothetical protein [Betaproteobacteria bacterium AqS2]
MNEEDLRMLRSVLTGGLSNLWPSPGRNRPDRSKEDDGKRPQRSGEGKGKEQTPAG